MRIPSKARKFIKSFVDTISSYNPKISFSKIKKWFMPKSELKNHTESLFKKFGLHDDVHVSAIGSANVEVKKVNGELHINNHAWHEISLELESGRIGKFCEKLSLRSSLSHADEIKIRDIRYKNVPAKILADIDESFVVHNKKFGDIGTTKLKNAENLSSKSKRKITKYVTSIVTLGAVGAVAGITYASVVSEMHKAEGCFLYDGISDMKCKLTDRSCAYPQTPDAIKSCTRGSFTQFFDIDFNTNLNLVIRKTLEDSDQTEKLKTALNVPNITVDNIENLIEDHYDEINDFYERNGKPNILNPCNLFKGSTKPICVACDSNAAINSYRYLDTGSLTINQKSYCSDDPSILKALGTAYGQGMKGLLDGLGASSFFGTFFEYIMYAIVGFILLCGVGYAVSFLRKNKGDDDDEVRYSKLENEDD